jgi:RNA polymerase sigma-70 factor (ECF subfamily)
LSKSTSPSVCERQQPAIDDESLLCRLSAGDSEACSILFGRFARTVKSVGQRILRDNAEADDLVQEVFLYIHRRATLFDRSKSSARSWIFQVAYTQALIRRRQLKCSGFYAPRISDMSRSEELPYDDPVEELFGINAWKKVWNGLTECQRETLRLHFYEGCTFTEIAKKLGQSYVNIRHHYYRALEKLRKHADENGLNWP